jgi:hypothetical protein
MTNLKRFALVLAVPLLVMPQLAKTATLDASDLYIKPLVFNFENITNTSKDNYVISYSSSEVKDGIISFDAQTASFAVSIANKSTAAGMPLLQSVTYKLYVADNLSTPWQTVKVSSVDRTGKYSFTIAPNRLDANKDYKLTADLVFTSSVEGSIPVIINNPDVAVLTLKHKVVSETPATPVFTENYKIVTNPNVSGTYTFNTTTNKNFLVSVSEQNANLDTKIQAVTLRIINRDTNAVSYTKTVTGRAAQFALDFSQGLDVKKAYKAYADVTYMTGSQSTTRNYYVIDLVGDKYNVAPEEPVTPVTPVFSENSKVITNPNISNFTFNYTTNSRYNIAVSEKDANADTKIQAVTLKIINKDSNELAYTKTITGRSAQFNLEFAGGLRINQSYKASVDVKYVLGSQGTSSSYNYFVANLIGEDYGKVTPTPVFSENYQVITNPNVSNFTFNHTTNNRYNIAVSEKNANADTKIQAVTLKIYNKDGAVVCPSSDPNALSCFLSNELAYSKTITGRSAQFNLEFTSGLRLNQSYKASVEVKYVTGSEVTTRTYFVANLIGQDYGKIVPQPEPQPQPQPQPQPEPQPQPQPQPVVPQEIDNLRTIVNVTDKSNANYDVIHTAALQQYPTVAYSMPRVSKIELLANGSVVESCVNGTYCSFNHKIYSTPVNLQVKASYVYDYEASNYSYSKTYDLGTYSKNVVNPVTPGSNDPTLLNQYVLIKGSGPQVYLVNKAGNRYYIPAWSVLKSWYHTAPSIIQVNDAELPQYKLKGNMIYKPGSLIKIATDPKCYAVDKNGVLRWVINENVARAIYGKTWNKNIHIIPDSLFPSYSFGDKIDSVSDYSIPMLSEVVNMYNN